MIFHPARATAHPGHRQRLSLIVLVFSLFAGFMATMAPATAQADGNAEASPYRMARVDGTEYVFDVPMTADFAAMVTCAPEKYARFRDLCAESSEEIGGAAHTVIRSQVTWDKDLIDNGQVAFARDGMLRDMSWWMKLDQKDAGWPELAKALRKDATKSGTWSHMDILVVTSPPAGEPLRLPVPAGELAVRRMVELSGETKAGTYYPNVKVPKDLDGFRAQMLAFSNAGRRDPDFRKNHRTATVTDLSLNEVITKGGAKEKVFRENDTPPYFSDQKSDPALDKMAQFQAEYNASREAPATPDLHNGPARFTFEGRTASMLGLGERSAFFGAPSNVVEGAAGPTGVGSLPLGWMTTDTHFRPFFNVDGSYPIVGYGAAQSAKGNWYYIFVPRRDTELPPKKLDEVKLPVEVFVGAPAPEDATLVVEPANPPGPTTSGPVVTPAPTEAPAAPPATAPPGGAAICDGKDLSGACAPITEGVADVRTVGIANDTVSSIRVPEGKWLNLPS
jgi:hypothetical protein